MLIDCQAPDFKATACMPDNSFKEVRLADYKEVPGFEKLRREFEARNCVILGCSTDTQHAHKGWKILDRSLGGIGEVNYPLIADVTKEIAAAYDVLQPDGLCARGLFLIDKEGFVRAEHKNCDPLGRNLDEPLRLLDALQFHEKSKAEGKTQVCPAQWKLGKKGLTPTMEGVGTFNNEGGVSNYIQA